MRHYKSDETRTCYYLHHAEQVEAAREAFRAFWLPIRCELLNQGASYFTVSKLENNSWQAFLTYKNLDEKTK